MQKKLVIFGIEDFADIAYEYFTHDSDYEVAGFTVNREYMQDSEKFGLPVVAFEDLAQRFPPSDYDVFVAVVYGQLNRLRADICKHVKLNGYTLATYISSHAFVWHNVEVGENCFVFEDNTVQPFVTIGDDVILWSGNHIGHHSKIGNHCFITSHVVVSGWNRIGDYCFIGVNSTLANNTSLGARCWVSHGAVLSGDVPEHQLVKGQTSEYVELNEKALFRSLSRASKSRK